MAGLFPQNLPAPPNTSLFQTGQPYPPPQLPQNVLPTAPVTDAQRIPLYNELVGAKLGYEQADKGLLQLNQALENPDLTDDQRKKIQDLIPLGETTRQSYSDYANYLRNSAGQLGIDVSDYGTNKTLQQAAQALNNYSAGRVRDLLGLQTPRAQEETRYRELRARGASPAQAHRILNREREGIQENYLQQLNDGMMTYGVNPDGSMNAYGMMLAQKMNPGNPQTALSLFANGFAAPKEVFNANKSFALQTAGNQAAQERQQQQIDYNTWHALNDWQFRDEQLNKTLAAQKELAQLKATLKGTGMSEDKIGQEIASLMRLGLGLTEQQAAELVLRQKYKDAFKILDGDKNELQDKKKFETFTRGQFGIIEHYLQSGDFNTAKNLIGQFRLNMTGDDGKFKYSELMDEDSAKFLLSSLDDYELVADGKMTLDQLNERRQGAAGSSMGDRVKYENSPERAQANEYAKQIGEEAARKQRLKRDMTGAFWNRVPPQAYSNTPLVPYGRPEFFPYPYR